MLDIGCGPGIEARQFQARGRTVLGVEPDARMAASARGRGLDALGGRFTMEWTTLAVTASRLPGRPAR